eukprot:Hpha_TRINITY_DN3463_c0_g1::TRINITY_DN3463_c0_g1_i1::g.32613::m.32613
MWRGPLLVLAVLTAAVGGQKFNSPVDVRELDVDDCLARAGPPRAMANEWCSQYNSRSCCNPAADEESHVMFARLMDLGKSCSFSQNSIMELYSDQVSFSHRGG